MLLHAVADRRACDDALVRSGHQGLPHPFSHGRQLEHHRHDDFDVQSRPQGGFGWNVQGLRLHAVADRRTCELGAPESNLFLTHVAWQMHAVLCEGWPRFWRG